MNIISQLFEFIGNKLKTQDDKLKELESKVFETGVSGSGVNIETFPVSSYLIESASGDFLRTGSIVFLQIHIGFKKGTVSSSQSLQVKGIPKPKGFINSDQDSNKYQYSTTSYCYGPFTVNITDNGWINIIPLANVTIKINAEMTFTIPYLTDGTYLV